MRNLKRFAIMVLGIVIAAVFSSCEKEELWMKSDVQVPEGISITHWGADSQGTFVCDRDITNKYYVSLEPSLEAERTFFLEGNNPLEVLDSLDKRVASPWDVVFHYNYNVENTVKADVILTVVVNNEEITVRPIDTLWIKGVHEVKSVTTSPFGENSQTRYTLVNQRGIKLCEAIQEFQINGTVNLELVAKEFTFNHLAWEQAVVNGANVVLKCNNMASLVGVYSDGRSITLGNQLYKVTNNYQVQGLNVTFPIETVGNTYNFSNGNVTVAGNNINIIHQGDVVDNIIIDGVNYKDSVVVCHATPKTITFNSVYAEITFIDGSESIKAIIPVSYEQGGEDDEEEGDEEEVTLTGVTKSFEHISYNTNANVSGNQINLVCNNVARFVGHYSNGTDSLLATVNYNVTNSYNLSAGTLSTSSIGAQATFTHNGNGVYTATIGGENVTLNYQGTTVANIIYDGVNYKNDAPLCVATPTTITLISSSQARITFVHGNEEITAIVAVTTQTPTTGLDLQGQVVKAYVTLSYTSNMSTTPEVWFHVLVNDNGTYKIYSALWQNGLTASSFAQTSISANQYNTLIANLNAGEGIAKVYHHYNNGATFVIGTVKGQQYSSGAWKISYYNLSHTLENVVDFSAQTFSGYNGENPIKAVRSGAGVIIYNGITVNIQ